MQKLTLFEHGILRCLEVAPHWVTARQVGLACGLPSKKATRWAASKLKRLAAARCVIRHTFKSKWDNKIRIGYTISSAGEVALGGRLLKKYLLTAEIPEIRNMLDRSQT